MKLVLYCVILALLLSFSRQVNGLESDEDDIATTDEPTKIVEMIKALQPDNSLAPFSKICCTMKKATGILPKSVIPTLKKLSHSYSNTTNMIKVSFNETATILSKFVVKTYHVLKLGMNKKDKKVLMKIEQQLNTNIINKLDALVASSQAELVEIHKKLLFKSHGGKTVNLLKKRDCGLLRRMRALGEIEESSPNMISTSHLQDAQNKLRIYEANNSSLKYEDIRVKEMYNRVKEDFYRVDEEIQDIYQSIGTVNINSLKVIDELSRAVQNGTESIVSTYGKLRSYLKTISGDEDLLVSSAAYALEFMNIVDAFMGTTRIQHIKQVLSLE